MSQYVSIRYGNTISYLITYYNIPVTYYTILIIHTFLVIAYYGMTTVPACRLAISICTHVG